MLRSAWAVLAILAGALTSVSAAEACSPTLKPLFWRDRPIEISADGSFRFGEEDFYSGETGQAVLDIGGGKVGQRIIHEEMCSIRERLLVADCDQRELIAIWGLKNPEDLIDSGGGPPRTVDMLYPPRGKIRLTKSVTVAELISISEKAGYQYQTDPAKAFAKVKKKNRYNPFNGCKIFYPDSLGARQ